MIDKNIGKTKICKTLKVSRSAIYWRGYSMKRGRYKKNNDESILRTINEIIKIRPTYGYKRVTAMVNKRRKAAGLSKLNRKRIYRIMDMNGLIFKKLPVERDHVKTGKIITLHSNTRWCSDGFEIKCFNGEKVYVAFSLDCHDRECLSYVAYDRPLLAIDIQELMINSVDHRFDNSKTSRVIQFLSDRGSIYRSPQTVETARFLGLKSCFTAAYSPESNGMSESFVGTMKRDYVYTSDCKDAKTVLKLLKDWFQDYNEEAPHSGLGMMSPIEYKKNINSGV